MLVAGVAPLGIGGGSGMKKRPNEIIRPDGDYCPADFPAGFS
jgi:hypothetical protein